MVLAAALSPGSFGDLPGWVDDDHDAALAAFRRSAFRVLEKPYRTGSLGIACSAVDPAYAEARALARPDGGAREFFERHFIPCAIKPDPGRTSGFVTGFYEPVADASPVKAGEFIYPLYARPDDLVDVGDGNRPAGLDPYLAFGRLAADGHVVEYHDRAAIERGALRGRGLEIAWLADRVDLFFIHVQGAARLRMPDGATQRVTYAAKSGQRFTGPGGVLADLGEIPRAKVTMQSIRAWLRAHPERIDDILWRNRSFIFFRDAEVDDPHLGPVAAAKVPLTAGRSIAVDRLLHTFGTPIFVDSPTLAAFGRAPFRRLMIAQDTGSAIVGAARGDLFAGSGDAAGEIAGVVKHDADFHALVPRRLVEAGR